MARRPAPTATVMLLLLTYATLVAVTVVQGRRTAQLQRAVRSQVADCQRITNASDRDVASVKSYYRNLSENAKCLLKCVYEQMGLIRDDKFIDQKEGLQLFRQLFAHDKTAQKFAMLVVDKCLARGRSATSACQGAYLARICFLAFRL